MFRISSSLALATTALAAAALAAPASAQTYTVVVEEWVETVPAGASRYVSPQQAQVEREAIASFGPFRVIDEQTAALVGITDSRSHTHFAALLQQYPQIAVLDFVEAPGTHDDVANMAIGRVIRERGIATQVGEGGSVRSGAVELFLSGAVRSISPEAEFAVHGWLDYYGRGASDYPAGAPEHRRYLDYYAEMGMDAAEARAFYAMTNSVPFEDALWLTGVEMRGWLGMPALEPAEPVALAQLPELPPRLTPRLTPRLAPRLAYLDLPPLVQ